VVTYQDSFKSEWLGISESLIGEQTSVSSAVTEIMATQVLAKSAFASISAAVTGHLGPDVEPAVDGILFVAIAIKSGSEIKLVECEPFRLSTVSRCERQTEATEMVLQQLVRYLKDDRRST
jgi:nicotinamide-nucleotide amidase